MKKLIVIGLILGVSATAWASEATTAPVANLTDEKIKALASYQMQQREDVATVAAHIDHLNFVLNFLADQPEFKELFAKAEVAWSARRDLVGQQASALKAKDQEIVELKKQLETAKKPKGDK